MPRTIGLTYLLFECVGIFNAARGSCFASAVSASLIADRLRALADMHMFGVRGINISMFFIFVFYDHTGFGHLLVLRDCTA